MDMKSGSFIIFQSHGTEVGNWIKPEARRRKALRWCTHWSGTSQLQQEHGNLFIEESWIFFLSVQAFALGKRWVLTPARRFTRLCGGGYRGGGFARSSIQMLLQCWTRRSRPTPQLLPPEGDDLLVFCPQPHTPAPFPGWHLLALSASRQFLAVSHRCSGEAAVCALTSGAPGSGTSGAMGAGEDPPRLLLCTEGFLQGGNAIRVRTLPGWGELWCCPGSQDTADHTAPIGTPVRAKKSCGQPAQRHATTTGSWRAFPPLWVMPACLSSHTQGESLGQQTSGQILYCFSNIVPDMMRTTSAECVGLVCLFEGVILFLFDHSSF